MAQTNKKAGVGAKRMWPLFVGLPLILGIAVAAVLFAGGEQPAAERQQPRAAQEERPLSGGQEPQDAAKAGHPSLGDANAPVVMIEYGDFQCTFCGRFAREVEPELRDRYVESGTLRMEWRDFPYLGSGSVDSALAARAAQEQGKFWVYHDLLYRNQAGGFPEEKLVELAHEAGLDAQRFEADLASGEYKRAVAEDFEEGQQRGVSSTPTFVINGKVLAGAQPLEVFEDAIERAKREAGQGS